MPPSSQGQLMFSRHIIRAGFTLLETLVSMIILSLVMAALAPLVTTSVRALGIVSGRSATLFNLAEFNERYRELCSRTSQPVWASSKSLVSYYQPPNRYELAFLDGNPKELWSLEYESGKLVIDAEKRKSELPVDSAEIGLMQDTGRVIGIKLQFSVLGSSWTWRERFASTGF